MVPPKRWKASSDSQTSITRHPPSVGPATWERIPSVGQASRESSPRPSVTLLTTSSYCSRVPPGLSWIIKTGKALPPLVGFHCRPTLTRFQPRRTQRERAPAPHGRRRLPSVGQLPRRRRFEEPGAITLPRVVFSQLQSTKSGHWGISDVGALAVLVSCFEEKRSLVQNATFEERDGEVVLVARGRSRSWRSRTG